MRQRWAGRVNLCVGGGDKFQVREVIRRGDRYKVKYSGCAVYQSTLKSPSTIGFLQYDPPPPPFSPIYIRAHSSAPLHTHPLHSTVPCPPLFTSPAHPQLASAPLPLSSSFRICTTPSLPGTTPSGLSASRSWTQRMRRSEAGGGRWTQGENAGEGRECEGRECMGKGGGTIMCVGG